MPVLDRSALTLIDEVSSLRAFLCLGFLFGTQDYGCGPECLLPAEPVLEQRNLWHHPGHVCAEVRPTVLTGLTPISVCIGNSLLAQQFQACK